MFIGQISDEMVKNVVYSSFWLKIVHVALKLNFLKVGRISEIETFLNVAVSLSEQLEITRTCCPAVKSPRQISTRNTYGIIGGMRDRLR